jgi:glycosyltransferase involved in cell wall biosynthesis
MLTTTCLTVTRLTRLHLLRRAVLSYARQSVDAARRELVLVQDDGPRGETALRALLNDLDVGASIVTVDRAPLGQLRNEGLAQARGDLVCQWDDDDFFGRDRLECQMVPFHASGCLASSLDSQLLWFIDCGDLYVRRGPKEGIHGTVMFRNHIGLKYDPTLSRGEDTIFIREILDRAPSGVARIDDRPDLYVRTYHGGNTWSLDHHRKQTARVRDVAWLRANEGTIRQWLRTLNISDVKVRDASQVAFAV